MTPLQQAKSVAREPYAWPGGYPKYLVMSDGGCLCPSCVKKEFRLIARATIAGDNSGWRAEAADINYEDLELRCDHCGAEIPAAYTGE